MEATALPMTGIEFSYKGTVADLRSLILPDLNAIIQEIHAMAKNIQDLATAFADLKTALTNEIEEINGKIQELQDLIAMGGTEAERDALFTEITDATAKIQGIINTAPIDPPTPVE